MKSGIELAGPSPPITMHKLPWSRSVKTPLETCHFQILSPSGIPANIIIKSISACVYAPNKESHKAEGSNNYSGLIKLCDGPE
jgi:hypothetical protein